MKWHQFFVNFSLHGRTQDLTKEFARLSVPQLSKRGKSLKQKAKKQGSILLVLALLLCTGVPLSSCKKSTAQVTSPTGSTVPACVPTNSTTNRFGTFLSTNYTYLPDDVLESYLKGKKIIDKLKTDNGVIIGSFSSVSAVRFNPSDTREYSTFDYSGNPVYFLAGHGIRPDFANRSVSSPLIGLQANIYSYQILYDIKGRIVKLKESYNYSPKTNDILTLTIYYDNNDNATELLFVNDIIRQGQGSTNSVKFTITGYDNKPNPYAGVFGWAYFDLEKWSVSAYVEAIVRIFSKNNMLGWEVSSSTTQGTISKFSVKYTYNENELPITAEYNGKDVDVSKFWTETFTYKCQ
jgi:hypothetical protein